MGKFLVSLDRVVDYGILVEISLMVIKAPIQNSDLQGNARLRVDTRDQATLLKMELERLGYKNIIIEKES